MSNPLTRRNKKSATQTTRQHYRRRRRTTTIRSRQDLQTNQGHYHENSHSPLLRIPLAATGSNCLVQVQKLGDGNVWQHQENADTSAQEDNDEAFFFPD